MKRIIVSIFCIAFFFATNSAQDTTILFFDSNWKECIEKKAKYYTQTIAYDQNNFIVQKSTTKGIPISIYSYSSLEPLVENGEFQQFDKKGKVHVKGSYLNGYMDGLWLIYNKASKSFDTIDYTGVAEVLNADVENPIEDLYFIVDEMPKFGAEDGDGMENFKRYLEENIRYPERAAEKGSQGIVYVEFIVGQDGNIYEPKILREADIDLMIETLRIVINSPKWKPGKQDGKPVAVSYTLPVHYHL